MVVEKFQSYSVKIIEIHLWVKKLNLFIHNHATKQNSPPGFYHYPPGRPELPIPPEQRFLKIYFLRRKGERIMELKELPKLTKVSVTSFDKFHHLCNLYILDLYMFCYAIINFKHADVWRFFNLTNKVFIKKYDVQE